MPRYVCPSARWKLLLPVSTGVRTAKFVCPAEAYGTVGIQSIGFDGSTRLLERVGL